MGLGLGVEILILRNAPETLYHRLWRCPRWARHRLEAAVEAAALPPGLAATGALWLDPRLAAACAQAEAAELPMAGAGERPAVRCWTDGSAVHPRDPLLRRAAWAVAGAAWATRSGPCLGSQTVAQAELAAVVWAAEAAAGRLRLPQRGARRPRSGRWPGVPLAARAHGRPVDAAGAPHRRAALGA